MRAISCVNATLLAVALLPSSTSFALGGLVPKVRSQVNRVGPRIRLRAGAHDVSQGDGESRLGRQALKRVGAQLRGDRVLQAGKRRMLKLGRRDKPVSLPHQVAHNYLMLIQDATAHDPKKSASAFREIVRIRDHAQSGKLSSEHKNVLKNLGIDIRTSAGRPLDSLVAGAVARHGWVGAVTALRNGASLTSEQTVAVQERGVEVRADGSVFAPVGSTSSVRLDAATAADYLLAADVVGRAKAKTKLFGGLVEPRERTASAALEQILAFREIYETPNLPRQSLKRTNANLKKTVGLPVPEGASFDQMVRRIAREVLPAQQRPGTGNTTSPGQVDPFLNPGHIPPNADPFLYPSARRRGHRRLRGNPHDPLNPDTTAPEEDDDRHYYHSRDTF